MASSRRTKKMNTKTVITLVVVLLIVAVAAFFGIRALRSSVTKKYGGKDENEFKTATVTSGSISTTVSGSGRLANQDSDDITIPSSVGIAEVYVEAGDLVKKGDILAAVNSISVTESMADIQSQIEELDAELNRLEKTTVNDSITSKVSGRIKKVYASEGVTLASVMYENEALMLVSLDGYMAFDIDTTGFSVGSEVDVTASDGTVYAGRVESVWADKTTILVTDDGTEYGDTVKVKLNDGTTAEGTLYIHEKVSVTGYTGKITEVLVAENDVIEAKQQLLTLENNDNTVNYQTVLKKRETLENELQNLITIYKEGAVYAKADGIVTSISGSSGTSGTMTASTSNSSFGSSFGNSMSGSFTGSTTSSSSSDMVISISPTDKMTMVVSVDETEILSLSAGQEATVTVSSISEESFKGTITKIDKTGTSSSGVTSYSAVVEIDRTDKMLEGMSASALIIIEGKENALLVPSDAVKKTSSTAYVYTSYDEDTKEFKDMVEVTIGLSNGSYTEITSGLKEGDVVYYSAKKQNNGFNFGGNGFSGFGNGDFPGFGGGGGNFPGFGGGSGNGGSFPGFGGGSGNGGNRRRSN